MFTITLSIILITAVISITGFRNGKIVDDLIFWPPAITKKHQYYRFITCGLIHADYMHLIFNMLTLYFFGRIMEVYYMGMLGLQNYYYLALYIGALIVSNIPTFLKHRNDYNYRSLGASGAVSAVVFCFILLFPLQKLGLIFFPVMIPGFIFGSLYLVVSSILERRSRDNINHSAHIWGALYGVVFLIAASNFFSSYSVLQNFVEDVRGWLGSF